MQQPALSGFRLSPHQKHIWRLQEGEEGSPYRSQCAIVIEGDDFRIQRLSEALQYLVTRHEILHTTFRSFPGSSEPLQVVVNDDAPSLRVCDLTHLSDEQQVCEIEAIFEELKGEPLDLQCAPSMRVRLALLSPSKRVLFISLPALCADSATLDNLMTAIACSVADCPIPDGQTSEQIQYADLSEIFNELLEAEDTEDGRSFWRKKDLLSLSTLKIPFETRLAARLAFKPQSIKFHFEAELMLRLRAQAQKAGAMICDYLLTAWALLLWRTTGQAVITVGVMTDGREDSELSNQLGLLAHHIPVQVCMRPQAPFCKILQEIAENRQEAYEWQDYFSWDQVAQSLGQNGEPAFLPFCFHFEERPASVDSTGLLLYTYKKYAYVDRFKISICCVESHEGLETEFHFDSNLYSSTEITRIAEQFHALVEGAMADPQLPIYRLEMLSASERKRLLAEPVASTTSQPQACLHKLFEDQAARRPDAIAIVCEGESLSYRSLNARANDLACRLQSMGVVPDTLVAIYVERSVEMVVGILGILKAGAAYAPLDPQYPKQRISFLLDDTKARVILTQRRLVDQLQGCAAQLLCIDGVDVATSRGNLAVNDNPAAPAYVIYTSGSTGNPKGVVITHSNVARLLSATQHWYGFNEDDVWTLFHSYAFDFSVWEIWGALLYGGKLVIIPYLLSRSPESFYELLTDEGVTILNQTPSAFRQLVSVEDAMGRNDLRLRFVIFGGEALEIQSLKPWFAKHGDQRPQLINMYGITETTVHVTYRRITLADLGAVGSVIGCAIPGWRIYILDPHGQLAPVGVPGEIYVAGAGLSTGYLNRPGITAEKFIPDPFTDCPGARLYRSGDLASYLANGDVEYLGRADNQVKIRGFRIELGEIESTLTEYPAVRQAVVLVRDRLLGGALSTSDADSLGSDGFQVDKQIVAYICCDEVDRAMVSNLRRHMEERLPAYLIPSSFVLMHSFPLTVNGKVDRKALPAPEGLRPEMDIPFMAPRTPIEREVAQIWSELLRVEPIGIYDSFFHLGGHSLLLTQLASRISESFQVDMPLALFFENPTIAEMTTIIAGRQAQQQDPAELAQLLSQLKHLSSDEVKGLLEHEES